MEDSELIPVCVLSSFRKTRVRIGMVCGVVCVCVCVCVCVQSCPTLCNPIDCSPLGSSVHEIFQARILEWVSASYSGDLPDPVLELKSLASPALAARFFTTAPPAPFSSVAQ